MLGGGRIWSYLFGRKVSKNVQVTGFYYLSITDAGERMLGFSNRPIADAQCAPVLKRTCKA